MSRELGLEVGGKPLPGWVMVCNHCWSTRSDVRPSQTDLPLQEFVDAGWYVGEVADACPACVRKLGGIADIAQQRVFRPHPLMAPPGGLGLLHSPDLWGAA